MVKATIILSARVEFLKTLYLTSSTVDLSVYIGKVKVWGQTFTGQKAGWLMDVGLVEIEK